MNIIWIVLASGLFVTVAVMTEKPTDKLDGPRQEAADQAPQPGNRGGRDFAPGDPIMRLTHQLDAELNLTPEQRARIAAIVADYQAQVRRLREETPQRAARLAERARQARESENLEAEREASVQLRRLRAEASSLIRGTYQKIGQTLRPDQRERFREILLENRTKMGRGSR